MPRCLCPRTLYTVEDATIVDPLVRPRRWICGDHATLGHYQDFGAMSRDRAHSI